MNGTAKSKIVLVLASGECFVCNDPETLDLVRRGRDIALHLGIPAKAGLDGGKPVTVEGPHVAYWFWT